MFKVSHKQLAAFFHSIVTQHERINLDFDAFLFGSIKPDLTSELILMPHYVQNISKHQLFDKINSIREEIAAGVSPVNVKTFSENMGEIIHYACDYFCLPHAHTTKKKMGVIRHNIYERRLARYLKKYVFAPITAPKCDANFNHYFASEEAFIEWINELNKKYHAQKISFKKDIHYAISVSLSILWYVFQLEIPFPEAFHPQFVEIAA